MPPRSNLFQKLVASVQHGFGSGWTVTESEMLPNVRTGRRREVDVVVRGSINGHKIVFGIECRDHKRPADVTWVEQIARKHADLAEITNTVLWSASGFTEQAEEEAVSLKIKTVSQKDAAKIPWAEMARHVARAVLQYVEPTFTASVDVERPSGEKERFALSPGMFLMPLEFDVNDIEAEDRHHLIAVLEQMKNSPKLGNVLLDNAPDGAGDFCYIYEQSVPCNVFDDDGRTNFGSFMRMVVGVRTVAGKAPIDARTVLLDGVAYTLGAAASMDSKYEIQVQEREGKELEVVVTYAPTPIKKGRRSHMCPDDFLGTCLGKPFLALLSYSL